MNWVSVKTSTERWISSLGRTMMSGRKLSTILGGRNNSDNSSIRYETCLDFMLPELIDCKFQEERRSQMEQVVERGQARPANWQKETQPVLLSQSDIKEAKENWKWRKLATVGDLQPTNVGTT